MRVTARDIVAAIGGLPTDQTYHYINPRTHGIIEIVEVQRPEGPIIIKRYNPDEGETSAAAEPVSISTEMIWRLANAFQENKPLNIDRILGASYNTRSVLEALLAHCPQFYYCYPGRIENISGTSSIERGHKHLLWLPAEPHPAGRITKKETDIVISEIPNMEVYYESLDIPVSRISENMGIEQTRRHAQIQIALVLIGTHLGFKTWVAQNDRGIGYQNKRLGEMEGVVSSLQDIRLLAAFSDAIRSALYIDCIWFKNCRLMPAVIEIEDTTGITSGLDRMRTLQNFIPALKTRYVISTNDDDRERVVREANKEQYRSLNTMFFPYSAVEELFRLCQYRKIKGITEEFLDSYMEPVVM